MNYEELISGANLAFAGNQFKLSFEKSLEAIKKDKNKVEGYLCAGKAALSLGMVADAIGFFRSATEIDKKNGNNFFLLGYAQAMDGNSAKALQSLTKALELNCDDSLKGQIYKMMSMINTDNGDYDNALANLQQAEDNIGLDYEILQQKAACYAQKRDFNQTVFVLNQMKLLHPKDYTAYSLAFNIFMELEGYDEAKDELHRAEKFADLTMAYYNDLSSYTLLHDPENDTLEILNDKWKEALKVMATGLAKAKPNGEQVFEVYMRAAQLYLSMDMPENAIKVLDAAVDPVSSYNNGFSILLLDEEQSEENTTEYEPLSPEDEEALMQERWENGELDDISETVNSVLMEGDIEDPEELAETVYQYLTPTDIIPQETVQEEAYKIDENFNMEQIQKDMRNSLYITAYEVMKDYDNMFEKARELQASSIVVNQYSGIYFELKAGKYTNKENWVKKYKERINFWTKRMLEDPSDYVCASYRIRSYIDIGDFENAEQLIDCLPTDVKPALMEELNKAKSQRGGEDGSSY